ncbi:hypothetical protein [Bradyrhizobium diazoefficiens]|uniref:hypothetical protein n=1 Tax=Bradyrhizobium diazoefficiens TaxID=1355477 RepID=UPI00272A2D34|nr:hypothetical protein [Bradyrhizobium diazoefficiens]WLA57223.1 hypothetical protein QIH81_00325 [Bradyrhizobium diazoefficiens]
MLAAVPSDESRTLELFDLALRLLKDKGSIPPQLSDHFNAVLRQAKELATTPTKVHGNPSPQAIQLACRILEISDLRAAVAAVDGIDAVTPDVASRILVSLEERVAP